MYALQNIIMHSIITINSIKRFSITEFFDGLWVYSYNAVGISINHHRSPKYTINTCGELSRQKVHSKLNPRSAVFDEGHGIDDREI